MHFIGQLQVAVDLVPSDLLKLPLGGLVDVVWKRKSLTLSTVMLAHIPNLTASFAVSILPPET